ncbi:MAG: hypothetical protein RMJ28_07695 [Nitrososphaerota archaeon]|nr:hypothetical protein [Nitrososphaerota archaeon]
MPTLTIDLLPKFATDCLLGLLFHLDPSYRITITPTAFLVDGPKPQKAIENALEIAEEHIEERQATLKKGASLRLPMSGNDKIVVTQICRELGKRGGDIDALTFVKLVKDNLPSIISSKSSFRLIEILKPEFYEYNRVPGYSTTSLIKNKTYPLLSIALAVCGYLTCAVGRARINENEFVTVVVTPLASSTEKGFIINPDYIISHQNGYNSLANHILQRNGILGGLFPEPALHLLMASLMGGTDISVYAITEPGGNSPASIFTSVNMSLHRTYGELKRHGIIGENGVRDDFLRLLERALDVRTKEADKAVARAVAIRYSILLYEALHGLKPLEEFVYTVDREFMRWVFVDKSKLPKKGGQDFNTYMLQRHALGISRILSRAI